MDDWTCCTLHEDTPEERQLLTLFTLVLIFIMKSFQQVVAKCLEDGIPFQICRKVSQ